jgi:flagellar biosynthesis GTPase FlhF
MSSKDRKERILRLERERDHFYNNRSGMEETSDQASVEDNNYYSNDFGFKEKLNIKNGKHSFKNESRETLKDNIIASRMDKADRIHSTEPRNHIDSIMKEHHERTANFDKIVRKETSTRQKVFSTNKFYKTEKSLLEEERMKNEILEDSYEKLLKQVQQLQTSHLQDLRNTEQRFHSASSALQKALIAKAEELVLVSNKFASSEARYDRDSRYCNLIGNGPKRELI